MTASSPTTAPVPYAPLSEANKGLVLKPAPVDDILHALDQDIERLARLYNEMPLPRLKQTAFHIIDHTATYIREVHGAVPEASLDALGRATRAAAANNIPAVLNLVQLAIDEATRAAARKVPRAPRHPKPLKPATDALLAKLKKTPR